MDMDLSERWKRLIEPIATRGDVPGEGERLLARYREPQRRYHTVAHLEQGFGEIDRITERLARREVVELAFFFHDAVYSVYRTAANEAKSAALLREVGGALGIDATIIDAAARLVVATRLHDDAPDEDARLFLDVDLSILGQDEHTFDQYERDVRAEYAWLPTWYFGYQRRRFLRAMLARPAVFHSEAFRDRYERIARDNMARSLAKRSS
jgi:predicted metal-dependent HD superfamily phosphohydrolase